MYVIARVQTSAFSIKILLLVTWQYYTESRGGVTEWVTLKPTEWEDAFSLGLEDKIYVSRFLWLYYIYLALNVYQALFEAAVLTYLTITTTACSF